MNGLTSLGGVLAILLLAGGALGLMDRRRFDTRWLLAAALLVAVNDACLTNAYGSGPHLLGGQMNWQGKLLALLVSVVVASLPAFGWRRVGLTLAQRPGSRRAIVPAVVFYGLLVLGLALAFPNEPFSAENLAFQLTMPGLEEELFYRGVLLFALDKAFTGRWRALGVDWGWGAVLSCALFGLAHAFGYAKGQFTFEPVVMALTALPSFIAVWVRYRTQSLVVPVLLHNAGNTLALLV